MVYNLIVGISADCGQGYFLLLDLYFLANQVRPLWCLLGEFFDHRHKAFDRDHGDRVNMLSDLWSKFLPSLLTL